MHIALPSLNALRAFEAAARHLSMTKAAQELNVTAGALSHQIRGLEEYLEVSLFERRPQAIQLTAAGKLLFPGLHTGFGHIQNAVAELRLAADPNLLVISTPPGFTAKWLVPRLYRFSRDHPEVEARVSASMRNADFAGDGIDIAVRNLPLDHHRDDTLITEFLIDITYLPVCAPRLLDRFGAPEHPEQLMTLPLIHDETLEHLPGSPDWHRWFEAVGIEQFAPHGGLHFSAADHAVEAAVEGAGVLLSHETLAHDDIVAGRLVTPFPVRLSSGRGYFLVYPKRQLVKESVSAFAAWIKEEVVQVFGEPFAQN